MRKIILLATALLFVSNLNGYCQSNEDCAMCHGDDELTGLDKSGKEISMFVHEEEYRNTVHGELSCTDCHMDLSEETEFPHEEELTEVQCGMCHSDEYDEYTSGVHNFETKNNNDVPQCYTCHGKHDILSSSAELSKTNSANVSETCIECHGNLGLNEKYGIKSDRVKTYQNSFHGIAVKFGMKYAANCVSCHDSHEIRGQDDPLSSVYVANIPKTCGKPECHPGAAENYADGEMHIDPYSKEAGIVYYVREFFTWFTLIILAGLICHMILDFYRSVMSRSKKRKKEDESAEETIERLNLNIRIQHIFLFISVILLIITGMPLKFHNHKLAELLMNLMGGIEVSGLIHRISAVVMTAVGIYHLFYIAFTKSGRNDFWNLLPRFKDFIDVFKMLGYFFGISKTKPRFSRFTYFEKFDYWAVYWGMVFMIGTGAVLWFEEISFKIFPKYVIDTIKEVHSDEALLAALVLFIWHFYNTHLNFKKFPMNWVWWNGKMTKEEMLDEHPLEYEEIIQKRKKD